MSTFEETILSGLNMNAEEVNLDGKTDWGKAASVAGQSEQEANWDIKDISVDVYDLSKPAQRKSYQNLKKADIQKDPTRVILEQERKFCDDTSNWKIFVVSADITYKKLTGVSR